MKWTNPEKLDIYGVRLVGWPEGVPAQNPSSMKVSQNKALHEAMRNGTMRFEKITGPQPSRSGDDEDDAEANVDLSWAYDVDAHPPSPPPAPSTSSIPIQISVMNAEPPPHVKAEPEPDVWTLDPTTEVDPSLSSYSIDYSWGDEYSHAMMDTLGEVWDPEPHIELERPRKRPRSEEPGGNHVSK